MLIFYKAEDLVIILDILLKCKSILFRHPAAENIESIGFTLRAGGKLTDIAVSGTGFQGCFCRNNI